VGRIDIQLAQGPMAIGAQIAFILHQVSVAVRAENAHGEASEKGAMANREPKESRCFFVCRKVE
jgi:hypothetical protein